MTMRERLGDLMLRDERRLGRRLDGVGKAKKPAARQAAVDKLDVEITKAERRVERRRAAVPAIRFPAALPVSQRKDDLAAAIRDHQVVIVAGETGSGKTTQLPKICLELGRGVRGVIGHTQPRRIAARTVAERIADELQTPLGSAVGYKVRFTDRAGDETLVKVMTDGILLAEIQHDRELHTYDTLIIDEAHERSLNVDFILGYLKQLLPRRPDLKVIITSATIDPQRFSQHFDDAPVVEVSGRTYPVEVRYRPLIDDSVSATDRDQTQAICDAVDELRGEGPGDILVFLSGEREIRDTADALGDMGLPDTDILPLYARLSSAEQQRVFQPHRKRRIVLATNVAETSLTVPGIRYVIDPGTARISRYSLRLKVQRLPIEPISQASANQRKGRCGRVAAGICIRLYAEDDFEARPAFTDPEILRTNLASVILQMTALGLGDLPAFPFVDPPDQRSIRDGVALLHELNALDPAQADPRKRLTPVGRKLAQLPIDPRLARMVLEADRNGCLREVLIIAAALSIPDPRERPADHQQAADEFHARFADGDSDFLAFLHLWEYLHEQQEARSSNQFRKLCKAEFLHFLRVREWQDLNGQLRQVAKSIGLSLNDSPGDPEQLHRSLLAGLLSHIGLQDGNRREYAGARGTRFGVWPGSALFKKPPRWVMAAEVVETSRLWGRVVARIDPLWAERLGAHLVKRTYSEPHWEAKRGAVVAYETVTLYGVPLVTARKVNYGSIDPELSRELFIRHALVEGDWRTHHAFWEANRRLLADAEELEERARRRDLVVDDETLLAFYDARIGDGVVSARHFDSWWKGVRPDQPELLTFTRSMLVDAATSGALDEDFPDGWRQDDLTLRLTYRFEPGAPNDGPTVQIPLPVLNRVRPQGFDWLVPGLQSELVTALLRSLPKDLRRGLVPVPDTARAVLERVAPYAEPLLDALECELVRLRGVVVPRAAWRPEGLPAHLRMTFQAVNEQGRPLAESEDLASLQHQMSQRLRASLAEAAGIEQSGLDSWSFGTLPRTFERARGGHAVKGYPALLDDADSVALRVFATEAEQRAEMWAGTRRLLLLNLPSPVQSVRGRLSNAAKLALRENPYDSLAALLDDCVTSALDELLAEHGGPAWDEEGFGALLAGARAQLPDSALEIVRSVEPVLVAAAAVDRRIRGTRSPALQAAATDLRAQLSGLVYRGFVAATGSSRLPDLVRYLRAMERRLAAVPQEPARDGERMERVARVQEAYRRLLDGVPPAARSGAAIQQVRWLIEELRVSLFAQSLGTAQPVSEQRILRAIDRAAEEAGGRAAAGAAAAR